MVETTGTWPQGLLDAYIPMIPKADGGSTPPGQRPVSVLPVVPFGLDICESGLRGGYLNRCLVLVMVFHQWKPGSLLRWMLRRFYPGLVRDQLHVMVADVIKSFDTVDRSILDCALGRLVLPDWFRRAYFSYHSQVRLRFKLAAGLGEPWCRDGGIPQDCPLSMVFIVALNVPWCRHLEALPAVKPQLYADNLKCSAERPGAFFGSARFTAEYVRAVGQDVSPGKCVLPSTSKSVRSSMKLWYISGDGRLGKVQLDVRDLGRLFNFTKRERAGTLSCRVREATASVAAVGGFASWISSQPWVCSR